MVLAVTIALPTSFVNKYQDYHQSVDNVTSDKEFGWYAPIAILLSPLPDGDRRIPVQQDVPISYATNLPFQWPISPWYQPLLPFYNGKEIN